MILTRPSCLDSDWSDFDIVELVISNQPVSARSMSLRRIVFPPTPCMRIIQRMQVCCRDSVLLRSVSSILIPTM